MTTKSTDAVTEQTKARPQKTLPFVFTKSRESSLFDITLSIGGGEIMLGLIGLGVFGSVFKFKKKRVFL